ncbi:predicted protein [Naegleria gruberi]|uniref:Predicted protein n=1 Tax=Naegleria gruberi TaxID=5762 RepID=D2VJM5_NAEGR|nr:uncharacterized protein NAEGRDRAFT_69092 [Naegleria gruberi]EFC42978.1 predicted protein [Naegleria gruberi]|eukprot:XP_002675722.1 predicted protein [Naegleria gruberi strain NEG-M]
MSTILSNSLFIITLLLLVVSNSYQSTNNSNLTTVTSFYYPQYECLKHTPVNQFYYPFMFTLDTPFYDYCKLPTIGNAPQDFYKDSQLISSLLDGSFSCVDFLCSNDKEWNLSNKTQLTTLGVMWNYCFYCNTEGRNSSSINSTSEIFREKLMLGQCDAFSIANSSLNFLENFNRVSNRHCNGDSYVERRHLPFLEYYFFQTDYFINSFARYRKNNFNEVYSDAKTYISKVKLQSILTFYFKDLFERSTLDSAPLNIPVSCWCDYGSSSKTIGFQCYDYYQGWQLLCTYRICVVIFTLLYGSCSLFYSLVLVVPRIVERISSFKQRNDIRLMETNCKKPLYFIRHFLDIVTQPPIFFTLSAFFGMLENCFRFLFNFSVFNGFFNSFYSGIFRSISIGLACCGYSALVISWAHVIDLAKRKTSSAPFSSQLSKLNVVILTICYIGMLISGIVSAIILIVVKNSSTGYIFLTVAVLIYLFTFVVGFAFYGIKILLSLRKTSDTSSIIEYRFTKFILLETVFFLIGWIVSLFMLVSYVFGFDSMGLFWGLNRNIFMDTMLNAVSILSCYITFNRNAFEMVYGKKFLSLCSCEKNNDTTSDNKQ